MEETEELQDDSKINFLNHEGHITWIRIKLLGSYNRKRESRMAVAKRQEREKPAKIEQRKFQGPEWGPQVEQTAVLASPIYIGQVQGEEKPYKKRSQWARGLSLCLSFFLSPASELSLCLCLSVSLFSMCLLGWHALMPWGCIFLYFLNKTVNMEL